MKYSYSITRITYSSGLWAETTLLHVTTKSLTTTVVLTQGMHHSWHIKDFTTCLQILTVSYLSDVRFTTMAIVQLSELLTQYYLIIFRKPVKWFVLFFFSLPQPALCLLLMCWQEHVALATFRKLYLVLFNFRWQHEGLMFHNRHG